MKVQQICVVQDSDYMQCGYRIALCSPAQPGALALLFGALARGFRLGHSSRTEVLYSL